MSSSLSPSACSRRPGRMYVRRSGCSTRPGQHALMADPALDRRRDVAEGARRPQHARRRFVTRGEAAVLVEEFRLPVGPRIANRARSGDDFAGAARSSRQRATRCGGRARIAAWCEGWPMFCRVAWCGLPAGDRPGRRGICAFNMVHISPGSNARAAAGLRACCGRRAAHLYGPLRRARRCTSNAAFDQSSGRAIRAGTAHVEAIATRPNFMLVGSFENA